MFFIDIKQVADKCAFRTLQMSSMRNSNLVVGQFSVYRICLFSCLTKYNQLIYDRKLSICIFSYHYKDKYVINDILNVLSIPTRNGL